MAIQISGTEVISNSRGLNNIASVDATTAASISAAGVGGGGTVDFTASGAISAGDVVALNSDGTVSAVAADASAGGIQDTEFYSSSYQQNCCSCYDTINNVSVHFYRGSVSSVGVYGVVCTNTGGTLSFTSPLLITTNDYSASGMSACFDPASGYIILVGAKSTTSHYHVYEVSGGSLSSVSSGSLPDSRIIQPTVVYDGNAQKPVVVYSDYNNSRYSTSSVGTFSGTSLSWGTATVIYSDTNTGYYAMMYSSADTKLVLAEDLFGARVHLGTTSGTSVSWTTSNSLPSTISFVTGIAYDSNAGKYVFSANASGSSPTGSSTAVIVGSLSGTTFTYGSLTTLLNDGYRITSNLNPNQVIFDPSTNKTVVYSTSIYDFDTPPKYTKIFTGTVSGTTYTADSTSYDVTTTNRYADLIYDPDQSMILANNSEFVTVFKNEGSNNSDWIGISTQAISDTASGSITVLGGVNDQQTGLTIGTTYYADTDGTLTATANNYKVGKAIAATDLLITEGNT